MRKRSRLCFQAVQQHDACSPSPLLHWCIKIEVATSGSSLSLVLLLVCAVRVQHMLSEPASEGDPFLCPHQAFMLAGLSCTEAT